MTEAPDLRSGRVTAIRAQARSPERVSIYIDGRFAFGMHSDLLLEFDVARDRELSVEMQQAILRRDAFFKARAAAYRYLSYRERTAVEIERRLRRAGYDDDVIEEVVEKLESAGLVDDRRFATAYAEERFRSGGYGPMRVRADLRKKGVADRHIDAAVQDAFGEPDELVSRARELGTKRWEQLARESDERKRKKKVYDYLARRGFGFDIVRTVVEQLAERP